MSIERDNREIVFVGERLKVGLTTTRSPLGDAETASVVIFPGGETPRGVGDESAAFDFVWNKRGFGDKVTDDGGSRIDGIAFVCKERHCGDDSIVKIAIVGDGLRGARVVTSVWKSKYDVVLSVEFVGGFGDGGSGVSLGFNE